jgi:steroid 5-alpha reductase family enzyme
MNWQLVAESALLVSIFMHVMFVLAMWLKDNSIVDIGWGIGFIIIATHGLLKSEMALSQVMVYGMVVLWGLRLATYIHHRNNGKGEDFRYAAWRKAWGAHVVLRSYFQVFMLQGLLMLIIASPLYAAFSNAGSGFSWPFYLGVTMFGIGFYFEAVGDAQMKAFKADDANKGQIMRHGLWRYTRHPNYFGEALLWWGIALASVNSDLWYLSVIGPAVLTFLLLKVSGVAMLERKYDGDPRYADYVRSTNAFLPWRPRR